MEKDGVQASACGCKLQPDQEKKLKLELLRFFWGVQVNLV